MFHVLFWVFFWSHSLIQVIKTAKKLKKEKVNVDIINFGEEVCLALNQLCASVSSMSVFKNVTP